MSNNNDKKSQHNGPPRDRPPVFHECPTCLFLSPENGFENGQVPCPNCQSTGASRRRIPADRLRRFDQRIRGYHRDGEHEVVVILVSTFLETVFEDILARMMTARGAEPKVVALVLDTERSVGMRLGKLFPTLAGEKFEEMAAELGYRDFPIRWRQMRSMRNAFIHGESFDNPRETLDARAALDAMMLLDQAYQLFVLMNNRFVAETHKKRALDA
ncbi:MAG: hypothetical protein U1E26_03555 [Coriobacteriia bacterium]|nr:hypothetical protein [Coriobacteriia bacterium]